MPTVSRGVPTVSRGLPGRLGVHTIDYAALATTWDAPGP
ncbi:hypothetical protein SUDANB19_05106 [Streptomyces sp. enrichment culture]